MTSPSNNKCVFTKTQLPLFKQRDITAKIMDKYRLQWVGSKCGQHGPYTFFKGFKFLKNSKWRTISLGEFFFVKCSENDPLCIAELQLLWEDKGTEGIMLSSLRLYFLPEHTPDGRHHSHGENEVIAVNGKAIMSIEDLLEWVIMEDVRWIDGFPTICPNLDHSSRTTGERQGVPSTTTTTEEQGAASTFQGVASIKNQDGDAIEELPLSRLRCTDEPATNSNEPCKDTEEEDQKLMVVSYPSYCRYHGNLKRIEKQGDKWRSNPLLKALGLLSMPHPHTKLLFCRDEFDHPIMEEDERLCEYTAPKLKGRPRKKKVKLKSDDDRYEPPRNHTGSHNLQNTFLLASKRTYRVGSRRSRDRLELGLSGADTLSQLKAEFRMGRVTSEELFLTHLYKYMKDRNTPIDRVPHLGFKQLDLFAFFELAVKLGGYRSITSQKQWKVIYDQLGGNPNSTSAATCTRKHYERLLFPFEQHLRMPDKPDMYGAKDKKKKKDKKDKKRSRVKHVREQLQELEAWRQAERRAQEQMLEQAGLNSVVMRETSASVSTVTTTVPTSTATITPSMTVSSGEVKPAMSINGMPIMTMPPLISQSPVVQLQGGSHLYHHHLGLKNMGPVILAIPQVPVLAATTAPKQERESPALGHQAAEDQKQPLQQQPVPQLQPSTVLDKVSGGAPLMQQGEIAEVKQEEAVVIKSERTHSVMNNSVVKEERSLVDHSRHISRGVDSKHVRRASPVNHLNNVTLGDLRLGSQESLLPRPSVIQHTHPKKVKLESDVPSGLINSPLASAVQPNDLILRNMTKEQFAAEHEHYKKVVAEMPGLLGAGPRFLSPYHMTFLPQSPLLYRPPVELNNQAVMSIAPTQVTNKLSQYEFDDSKSKSLLPEPSPVKPHASVAPPIRSSSSASSSSSSSSASSSRSVKYEPVPEQEEPCDLSMPKKLKRYYDNVLEDEIYGKRRPSVISNANVHSASNVIRNSPVHRLRTSDKKVRKHSSSPLSNSREHHAMLSSSSPLHSTRSAPLMASSSLLGMAPKVKMTPNPRGSITQGIIDPATNQTHPSLLHKLPAVDPSKAPTPKTLAQELIPQHFPMDFPAALSLPMAVDSMGKPLQPLTDLSHLSRFPMLPYYPMLPRPTFLPAGSPFLQGLVPGIPTSQAESMLQQGLFFRPPFPFAPSVPYSTAQLPRDSTQASLYRS